jgi:hypothetical protein
MQQELNSPTITGDRKNYHAIYINTGKQLKIMPYI